MSKFLELDHVTKTFGSSGILGQGSLTVAVDDVSLSIDADKPDIITVVGESGSGKTTLARLLLGSHTPTSGIVRYNGKDFSKLTKREKRNFRREIQPIFQDPFESYNPFYKVDHVLDAPIKNFRLASSEANKKRMIEDALEMVGLLPEETLGRFPHQLSGGQRQRIMVARALLLKPKVILADEPVSMVDASLRATILDSIRRLNKELGISVVYITHDLTTAYQISDNIMVMYRGTVVESGSVDAVIPNPQHTYTKLLIESIPQPDPRDRWGAEPPQQNWDIQDDELTGCKFSDRCPTPTEECKNGTIDMGLIEVAPNHFVDQCCLKCG
ncbi:MAG: ABC transporter ATP-binding protein [SAR202 cluster bacterium]|nr:ABC transporter ATP-binding protein [SAR202 cluster bacterium]|tara:strand:+ start:1655 stop:2638 length:984 start_codon:yes stop_codon:yes gene_type:complete